MYNLVSANEDVIYMLRGVAAMKKKESYTFQQLKEYVRTHKLLIKNKLKHSVYNYCVGDKDDYIIYNPLYNTLTRMEKEDYEAYNSLDLFDDKLAEEFLSMGLWIDSELDEYESYCELAELVNQEIMSPLAINVATTTKCNARCTYCYEAGIEQKSFPLNKITQLVDFFKEQDVSKGVQIVWFGGEPLMNVPFIDKLVSAMEKEDINFTTSMISNGSLLNDNIIKKMEVWRINALQITIDGTKGHYERIKNYVTDGIGEYYTLLNNIVKVAEKGIHIDLRLNLDLNNLSDMENLVVELEHLFGKYEHVTLYPAFITGAKNVIPEENRVNVIANMLKKMRDVTKMSFISKLYSTPLTRACHYSNPHAFAIDSLGNIYTCEHRVGRSEYSIGHIDQGLVELDKRGSGVYHREECKKCKFLPKCFGGCEANYLDGDIPCMIGKYMIPAYIKYLLEK